MIKFNKNNFYFIAEAGVNHNGSVERAFELIEIAESAGADAVKFQIFNSSDLATKDAQVPSYAENESAENMLDLLSSLELDLNHWIQIINFCNEKEIDFICTPFDLQSAEFLYSLGLRIFKISSGDFENIPLIEGILQMDSNIHVILSTGMTTLSSINSVFARLSKFAERFSLLHCVSSYPVPDEQANLKAIQTLTKSFDVEVGYSDHTLGIETPAISIALGARIIEKHFTFDKSAEGPDHMMSLSPYDLKLCLDLCNRTGKQLGSGEKIIQECEQELYSLARRGVYWASDVEKSDILSIDSIELKRPFNGLTYLEIEKNFGKTISKDAKCSEPITLEFFND